jgi:NADH:ubiquinone oxidoreductase subunit E
MGFLRPACAVSNDSLNKVSAFTFTGQFAGFTRLPNGKRRMLLRALHQELVLKVPRELRQELDGMLTPGANLTVHGVERADGDHRKLVVSEVELSPEHRIHACTIRVCSKKNCWRQGGREIAQQIGEELERADLDDVVRVKLSGCLDCCKFAPTIACNEHVISECDSESVVDLVKRLQARLPSKAGIASHD